MRELNTASSTSCPLVSARRFLQRAVPPQQRHALGRRQLSLNQNQPQRWATPLWQLAAAAPSAAACDGAASGSSGTVEAEHEAMVHRLLLHSRHASRLGRGLLDAQAKRNHRRRPWADSDAELRQRLRQLLELGFTEAALHVGISQEGGGPYSTEVALGDSKQVLQAIGSEHRQLHGPQSSAVFTRSPGDVARSLDWLQQLFGMTQWQLAQACAKSPQLLDYPIYILKHNWAAVVEAFHPAPASRFMLASALQRGHALFILLPPDILGCGLP
jgi:hypothetical protein